MSEEPQLETRTKLPTDLDQEDPFIIIAEFRMSLRQTLTLVIGGFVWFALLRITTYIVPISGLFAGLLWSWILLASIFLTFVKKDGEPYEEYLSQKMEFWLSERRFINIDSEHHQDIEDADWEAVDDDDLYVDSY